MIAAEQEVMNYRTTVAALRNWVGRPVRVELADLATAPWMDIAAHRRRDPVASREASRGDALHIRRWCRARLVWTIEVPSITVVVYEKLFKGGAEYGGQELGVYLGGGVKGSRG